MSFDQVQDLLGWLLIFGMLLSIVVGIGWLMYSDTDGYRHKIKIKNYERRALADLRIQKAHIELELLKWQQQKVITETDRHAARLEGSLDELHNGGQS